MESMKNSFHRKTVEALVGQRLIALGARNIPAPARHVIHDDVWAAVSGLIRRRITAPVVGRAVAHALAAGTAVVGQGRKGADAPLPSSVPEWNTQESVAGRTPSLRDAQTNSSAPGVANQAEGGAA